MIARNLAPLKYVYPEIMTDSETHVEVFLFFLRGRNIVFVDTVSRVYVNHFG